MPHARVVDEIPAPAADVFRLLHDYDRRLEWDTLLQRAYLLEGQSAAGLGVKSVCQGKPQLGGIALTTEYISYDPPHVAAVRMLNSPPFFESFAATIRHTDNSDGTSRIEYVYNFTARPRWLKPLLHPIMNWMFKLETRKRLAALRRHFAASSNPQS